MTAHPAPSGAPAPACPKCGTTMCQQFDYKPVTPLADIAIPNGDYRCYRCGHEQRREQPATGAPAPAWRELMEQARDLLPYFAIPLDTARLNGAPMASDYQDLWRRVRTLLEALASAAPPRREEATAAEVGARLWPALFKQVERERDEARATLAAQQAALDEARTLLVDAGAGEKFEHDRAEQAEARIAQTEADRDEAQLGQQAAELKLRLYENGNKVNQPLVDDVERFRVAAVQAMRQRDGQVGATRKARAQIAELEQDYADRLTKLAAWIRTPGNVNSNDAIDECARLLENNARAVQRPAPGTKEEAHGQS